MPRRFIPNVPLIPLDSPIKVTRFDDSSTVLVKSKAEVTISFRPGILKAVFYVVDTPHPIIGTDILRDELLDLSLITGQDLFRLGKETPLTKSSPTESVREYKR